jgi:hypothetical protein
MIILIDFKCPLEAFAETFGVYPYDDDSMWYVVDLFDALVYAALDSNKGYKELIDRLVSRIENESGESRSACQSACDLAITQILHLMDEIFANIRHVDLFKTAKDIQRIGDSKSLYTINISELPVSYI